MSRLFLLIVVFLIVSCTNNLDRKDYLKWSKDYSHNIHKKKTVNHIFFDLQYKSSEYMAISENMEKEKIGEQDIRAYDDLQNFELNIGAEDKSKDILEYGLENKAQIDKRLYYLSFPIQKDLLLIEGKDTLHCVMYHFLRSYDISKKRTLFISFEKSKGNKGPKTFIFNSDEFETGPVKIAFEEKDLNELAKIKLAK